MLERFLAGKTDAQIASELVVAETTIRKHIQNIGRSFFLEGRNQREELKALFRHYKPELLGEPLLSPRPRRNRSRISRRKK